MNVAEGKLYIAVGAQKDEAAAMACLNEVVAGELREFYVEGAAVVGGVSCCLWGGAVGHSSSLNGVRLDPICVWWRGGERGAGMPRYAV